MSGSGTFESFLLPPQNPPPVPTLRSKFSQLFNRRKASSEEDQYGATASKSEATTPTLFSTPRFNQSRPTLALRSRSDHIVPLKPRAPAKSLSKRKKNSLAIDPPPLVQAQSQAIIHSTLEVPASPTARGLSRPSTSSSRDPSSVITQESKKSHLRTSSRSSTCSLQEKLMFLTRSGHVMQYDIEGTGERLPEKMLELNKEAVAFASDAIPGRPWVLQISSRASIADANQLHPLKSSRSAFNLRFTEPKKNVETLFLVFDDPEDLYSWLFSVRKEIESLGGMEYRPDTRGSAFFAAPNRQSKALPAMQRYSRSSSALPLSGLEAVETPVAAAQEQAPLVQRSFSSQSETASSVDSSTADKLRDSIFSDGSPSMVATSFSSTTSTSPNQEAFNPNTSSEKTPQKTPSMSSAPVDAVTARMAHLESNKPTIQERRRMTASSPSLQQETPQVAVNRNKSLPGTPEPSPDAEKDRPLSVIAPLPHPSCLPKSSRQGSRKCSVDESKVVLDLTQERPKTSSARELRRKSSVESTGDLPKAKYSLFPSPMPVPQIEFAKPSVQSWEDTESKEKRHQKTRSRTLTLNLLTASSPPHGSPTAAEFDKPQRSPAATADMIASNFGAQPFGNIPSPVSDRELLDIADVESNPCHGGSPVQGSELRPIKQRSKTLSSMKSAPNMDADITAAISKLPAGPPPTGPLPAVPSETSPSSSYKSPGGNSFHVRSFRSSKSGMHSRNASSVHSRNPSYTHARIPSSVHNRSRNVSDASATSMYSTASSAKQHTRNSSRAEPPTSFPPRSSSSRHSRNRSCSSTKISSPKSRRTSRSSSTVACAY